MNSPKNNPKFDGGSFLWEMRKTMNKVCAQAGCKTITKQRNCSECQRIVDLRSKKFAKKRAIKSYKSMNKSSRVFYGTAAWKSLRDRKLKKDPLCQVCLSNGFLKDGHDIDHIIEIKDDYSLRLDINNLQTLCRSCHMHKTHKERNLREK